MVICSQAYLFSYLISCKKLTTKCGIKLKYCVLTPDACPTHLIVDFEKAVINAFESHFPQTQVKGCFFHLTQNVWRKIQELGLKKIDQQDPSFALQIRMIPAFAFAAL